MKAWRESARRKLLQADSSDIFELLAKGDFCDFVKHACKSIMLQNCAAAPVYPTGWIYQLAKESCHARLASDVVLHKLVLLC